MSPYRGWHIVLCSCSDSPDFIVVRDGTDASSPVIAQYCNTQRSEQVVSSGQQLYVDFIVDGQRQRNGFEATYEFVKDGAVVLGLNALPPTLHIDSPTLLQQPSEDHQGSPEVVPSYHASTSTGSYVSD